MTTIKIVDGSTEYPGQNFLDIWKIFTTLFLI